MAKTADRIDIPWANILLAVSALASMVSQFPALHSARPIVQDIRIDRPSPLQEANARLWQDPMGSVQTYHDERRSRYPIDPQRASNHNDPGPAGASPFDHRASTLGDNLTHFPDDASQADSDPGQLSGWARATAMPDQVDVLLVILDGSSYAEAVEDRIRSRYAVLAALSLNHLQPDDSEHLGYIDVDFDESQQNPAYGRFHGRCPFEIFTPHHAESGTGPRRHAGVIYVDDASLRDCPLQKLANLIDATFGEGRQGLNLRLHILGPRTSDALDQMLNELADPKTPECSLDPFRRFSTEILSPWATAADVYFVASSAAAAADVLSERVSRLGITQKFKDHGLNFVNLTCTDDLLARALIDELKRRGIDAVAHPEELAIISEWDTFYGRAMPATFWDLLRQSPGWSGAGGTTPTAPTPVRNRLYGRYLRGVDGKLPSKEADKAKPDAKDAANTEMNLPLGGDQRDYIRRLADRLRRDANGQEVRAVGILASNAFDKLVLLRALRHEFKDAVFFTTDLDALFLQPDESDVARNLIVASSYGLELHPGIQGGVPPFRDSYQTAEFLACRVALETPSDRAALGEPLERIALNCLQPQLFEVGRGRFFDLTSQRTVGPAPDLYPPTYHELDAHTLVEGGVATAVALFICLAVCRGMFRRPDGRCLDLYKNYQRRRTVIVLAGAVIIIIFLGRVVGNQTSIDFEPFTWSGGISIWPAEIIRLVTIFLALGCLNFACYQCLALNRIIGGDFRLRPLKVWGHAGAIPRKPTLPIRRLKTAWRHWRAGKTTSRAPRSAGRVWARYLYRSGMSNRFLRVGGFLLGYLLFASSLFYSVGFPPRPFRGDFSNYADGAILTVVLILFFILLFFVLDATRLARDLIWNIVHNPTRWPLPTIRALTAPPPGTAPAPTGKPSLPADAGEWLEIEFIGRYTQVVGNLIYLPFAIMLLVILSRNAFFDRWAWRWHLILVMTLSLAVVFACAVLVRIAAARARRLVLERLRIQLVKAQITGSTPDMTRIQFFMDKVEANQEGALRPFLQDPLLGAVLLPLLGPGLGMLIGYLQSPV